MLAEAWDEGGARVGRLDDGCVVPLRSFPTPAGAHLLLHLGIPVEVLDPDAAREALDAPRAEEATTMSTRAIGVALAFVTAVVSGVSIWVNGHAVKHFGDATVYTTAKNARRRRCSSSRSSLAGRGARAAARRRALDAGGSGSRSSPSA